ncbi:MAG: methyltransferase domain-containing protein [Verrucomicrobia bacterium]|nr:methyltransferase domain-containing protein [Verrucomicrobiota bacterium]
MTDKGYHSSRFTFSPKRRVLWQTLVADVFQADISGDDVVLDLGAGYGEFINAVKARRRIAVDQWEGMPAHLDEGVEGIVTSAIHLEGIADESLDHVFCSNVFEHLSQDDMRKCLAELGRTMKPGAMLDIVQPNFKYCMREYFDDYTHRTIYTDVSLCDVLTAKGFTIAKRVARFLPLTMNSRLPVHPLLIRLYLRSPIRPFAKQMWIRAIR